MNRAPDDFLPPGDPNPGGDQNESPEIEFLGGTTVYRDIVCWRCHKSYTENLVECSHCGAKNKSVATQIHFPESAELKASPIKVVLVTYGILLLGSILLAVGARLSVDQGDDGSGLTGWIAALEFVDTIVVLVAMGMTGLAVARIEPVPSMPLAAVAWLIFIPGLAVMIFVNQAYHEMLMQVLQIPKAENIYSDSWPVLLVLYCLQPAIIEELFARQMSLAVLRKLMGIHFSVFITALMFALMHIFVPLSVPYLFLLGVFLGYARVFGGTIFLPMILHFAHNLIVIISERT